MDQEIKIMVADESHLGYVDTILDTIEKAAKVRGTGIAKRSPEYVKQKMLEGKAIIALAGDQFAGFCYIESWGNKQYVANSGLIVPEQFRGHGLARKIKKFSFELSRKKFPDAKLFGLTSGAAVMKINTELGYVPVTFADLTDDDSFWKGCEGCVNFDVLPELSAVTASALQCFTTRLYMARTKRRQGWAKTRMQRLKRKKAKASGLN
jgi:hypothetical protein